MKKVMALGLIAVTAIALTGCTDSDASTPSPQTSGDLRKVRVAALPITETAALWGGIKAGIFAEHGLEVEVLPAQGGAQAIPALINGDIDFAIGQPFGPFRADLQNLGVVIIGNYASSYADGDDINAVVAVGEVRHHPAGRPGRQAGRGQQPGRGRRRHDHGGGGEGRRRPDAGSSSSRSPSRTPRPSSPPATSTPPGCPSPSSPSSRAGATPSSSRPTRRSCPAWPPSPRSPPPKLHGQGRQAGRGLLRGDEEDPGVGPGPGQRRRPCGRPSRTTSNCRAPVAESVRLPAFGWDVDRASLQKLADLAQKYRVLDRQPDLDRLIQQQ